MRAVTSHESSVTDRPSHSTDGQTNDGYETVVPSHPSLAGGKFPALPSSQREEAEEEEDRNRILLVRGHFVAKNNKVIVSIHPIKRMPKLDRILLPPSKKVKFANTSKNSN